MKYRVALIIATAILGFGSRVVLAQTMPLGGIDLSGWLTVTQPASQNKTDGVRAMLLAGKSADVSDDKGETPLGYAASFGNAEMTKLLLNANAPVDRPDALGNTPLHWAAQRGSVEVMRLLLDAKASVDVQNKEGITPLMMAARKGQVASVRLLMKQGADAHKQDYTGRDAIGWADGRANVLQALRASAG